MGLFWAVFAWIQIVSLVRPQNDRVPIALITDRINHTSFLLKLLIFQVLSNSFLLCASTIAFLIFCRPALIWSIFSIFTETSNGTTLANISRSSLSKLLLIKSTNCWIRRSYFLPTDISFSDGAPPKIDYAATGTKRVLASVRRRVVFRIELGNCLNAWVCTLKSQNIPTRPDTQKTCRVLNYLL